MLTTVHPPFDTRIFHKQAKTLVAAGYDVTLIAQHDRDEVVDGVRVIALPRARNRFTRIFGLTWRAFRLALRQRTDVYHFHDPELLPTGVALKLLTRAKVIYDVHESYPRMVRVKEWLPLFVRGPTATLVGFLEASAAKVLDAVITVSESIQVRFPLKKTLLVRNYPSLDLFMNVSTEASGPTSDWNLVYVGGLTRGRGIPEIVLAMKYLDERWPVRLILAGKFHQPTTESDIRGLPCFDRVELLGQVPHSQIPKVLQRARVGLACLHPVGDYTEGLPTKLFEYMAAGLPVVASNFPLWKEVIEGNKWGLMVDPLDPKDIARAIDYLLTHPEEGRRMGENGRRAVLEKYNWEREGEELLKLYKELLAR